MGYIFRTIEGAGWTVSEKIQESSDDVRKNLYFLERQTDTIQDYFNALKFIRAQVVNDLKGVAKTAAAMQWERSGLQSKTGRFYNVVVSNAYITNTKFGNVRVYMGRAADSKYYKAAGYFAKWGNRGKYLYNNDYEDINTMLQNAWAAAFIKRSKEWLAQNKSRNRLQIAR